MARRKKSPARLDREIAEALKRRKPSSSRRHHSTARDISDDAWDVAMDAILEHDPKKAAKIWLQIREEYGFVTAPDTFLKALHEVPADVRWKFEEYVERLGSQRDPLRVQSPKFAARRIA